MSLFIQLEVWSSGDQKLTHSLYQERPSSEEVIIVSIDQKSLFNDDQTGGTKIFDGSRKIYSSIIQKIQNDQPDSVLIDLFFSSKTTGMSADHFYSLLDEYSSGEELIVSLVENFEGEHPDDLILAETLSNYENILLAKRFIGSADLDGDVYQVSEQQLPYELFAENSQSAFFSIGGLEHSLNEDDIIYGFPMYFNVDGEIEKYIDLQSVEIATGNLYDNLSLEHGQLLINYSSGAYGFEMISFADVYNGEFEAGTFTDKIVLIGVTDAGSQDFFFTPIDPTTPMPGVEIHANAIQTILDEAFLRYQEPLEVVIMLLVMIGLATFATLYLPLLAGSAVVALELILFPLFAQWSFNRGVIPELIWPVFGVILAYFAVLVYRNMTEFKEKKQIKQAFGHYVSPELVAQISKDPGQVQLGGEKRHMSVLFLDIENFTTLSESLEPAEVVEVINTYFDALAKVIMDLGGTVDKFEGDAIMALFGAPLPNEKHALLACQAAMAIRSKVLEVNQQTGQNLNVRVGVATGDCIVGNMGSQNRFDYTAMGDTVNTASRLEGGNKFYGTRILVNETAMKGAQDVLFFRRVDRVRLKGKTQAIDLYEIMGSLGSVSEAGKSVVNTWHEAIEYYRNQNWDEAVMRIKQVQEALPEDGPSKTYLKRIEGLRSGTVKFPTSHGGDAGSEGADHSGGWDGTWTFMSK